MGEQTLRAPHQCNPHLGTCDAVAIGKGLGALGPRAKGAIAMDQLIGLGLTLVMVLLGVGLGAVLSLALQP
jgi:hypothetical protein